MDDDDWAQLADLGDCGALLDLPPLALCPLIAELAWLAAQKSIDVIAGLCGADPVSLDFIRP
ncbi:hypothetical protein TPA4_83 [Tsukamurella phage TPA4]|uniref:hypothetical protein n=1 Tax=Tsukamurella phage TPA4 TaxID=1647476 RepID=UPI0007B6374B|nr:hypothetical protein BH784_gp83 [Tsukamurella phage TPA4]AKJ72248.1 hypothetical protein TPA4_83 [Tsukamurella phage TPA4]